MLKLHSTEILLLGQEVHGHYRVAFAKDLLIFSLTAAGIAGTGWFQLKWSQGIVEIFVWWTRMYCQRVHFRMHCCLLSVLWELAFLSSLRFGLELDVVSQNFSNSCSALRLVRQVCSGVIILSWLWTSCILASIRLPWSCRLSGSCATWACEHTLVWLASDLRSFGTFPSPTSHSSGSHLGPTVGP